MKRSRFTPTARDEKRRLFRCARCGRTIREGEAALILRDADTVTTRHAGRVCPPAYVRPTPSQPFKSTRF